ncbi:MAG TPA: efflux RND transporter periplasmic adaptor subunit [Candidatus Brocadiaceae bacterium]
MGNNRAQGIQTIKKYLAIGIVALVGIILAWFILSMEKTTVEEEHDAGIEKPKNSPQAKGSHGGRLLSRDNFQIEVVLDERDTTPYFKVYAFDKGNPINPDEVKLTIELLRLGRKVDVINFGREGEYLRGDRLVEEPHSFDIKVFAEWNGQSYQWEYLQIEGRVELTPDAAQAAGIVTEIACPVQMKTVLELPGEIKINADTVVHVVPKVSGVVSQVYKNLGETVKHGDVIAVLDSREIAELKSACIAAGKRVELARANFKRKERLWKQKISSEKDYLASRQALAEEEINLHAATQKLLALGFYEADLKNILEKTDESLTRYEVRALYNGVVIEKHISIGESIKEDADIFVVADLSTIWVDVTVYARDLNMIKIGQNVTVRSKILDLETDGTLTYLGSLIGEQTRTATGRVVVQNQNRDWRPGLFVTVELVRDDVSVPVAVVSDAIQNIRGRSVVFVQQGNLFEAHPVELGRSDGRWVEIVKGILPGERYVAKNSFILKSELGKSEEIHED